MYDFLSKSKILIIDDFAGFRQSLKTMLLRLGAQQIDQASNGSEAIKKCEGEKYNIIFCDYNLGDGQDGQQILEELHQRSIMLKGTLFLMVTAETSTAQVMGAIEYRPDAYLTKPFTGDQLGQRLKRLTLKNLLLNKIFKAINENKIERAIELCDEVIVESPKVKYSCLRIKSELLEQLQRFDQAKILYEEVIKEQPVLWAMVGLGRIFFNEGKVSDALEHFVSMREAFPGQVSVLDWIAKCHDALGDLDKAEDTLKEAVIMSPKSVNRQATLGKVASSLNNHVLAQKAFAKTIHEGNYSCMLKPEHFEQYYDNTREVAKNLEGREKSSLIAESEVVHKKMERAYHKDPAALAANLSSAALLFSSVGHSDKTSAILTKLSTTLEHPDCEISDKQADIIAKNLDQFAQDKSNEKSVNLISARLDVIQEDSKTRQESLESEVDLAVQAKKLNGEGMLLVKQGLPLEALNKFREAIKLSPENMNFLLNASQIIIERAELSSDADKIQEAKRYLQETITIDDADIRWNRYQKLLSKVANA